MNQLEVYIQLLLECVHFKKNVRFKLNLGYRSKQTGIFREISNGWETVKEMLDISNIIIVDKAEINTGPVSPNLKKNMLLGAIAGVAISLGYILLAYLLDSKIKNSETAEQVLGLPVLGIIPYFEDQSED